MIQIFNEDISDFNLLEDSPDLRDKDTIEEIVLPTAGNDGNVSAKNHETSKTHEPKSAEEETRLKYTCKDCNLATTRKKDMDTHVRIQHLPNVNEEVKFECAKCDHIFDDAGDYNIHVRTHET